ncbi:MAG: WD40/YVTN/BNR-like repeat-containing protein [Terriglobia bacterium]
MAIFHRAITKRFAVWTIAAICITVCAGGFLIAAPGAPQAAGAAPAIRPRDYAAMRWRLIGPFRGGRAIAVAGVAGDPNLFYFGGVDGGVWKTTDAGRVWRPLWTHEPVASIGALAVAPSDPKIIYAGTGEADIRSDISMGDGVYKSVDAGKTWRNVGLQGTRHIGKILVDPKNANVVLVAALGHAYGPNPERGVFRSTDGGHTWEKVLYKDENTGAIDLCFDPANSQVVYAALYSAHRVPWSTYAPAEGPGSGIYKSSNGGVTWTRLAGIKGTAGRGLPTGPMGRIGLAVGYGKDGSRVYALIEARKQGGLYRSDDAGVTWRRVSKDPRITERGWYFGNVIVDPHEADIVYVADVSLYRSTDGGRTFTAFKGAPGGDDYHALWIDPMNSHRMVLCSDQGTVVTVDGGKTWTSWYNQATGQFYHVTVDNQFPFRVYGAQQDSGSASVASRGDDGQITVRDWHPVGAGESGYIAPDPSDPAIVYGGDTYGELHRYDGHTGQVENISPAPFMRSLAGDISRSKLRFTWTSPLVFSPQDPRTLYFGAQMLLMTTDRGNNWTPISPDLTVRPGGAGPHRGVIYTIAPSPVRAGEIWVGTDNGLIQLTNDGGKTWQDVTPHGLPAWSKISLIEASHFDASTAYAAVDRHRLGDLAPHIYRTQDAGKTWTSITSGIDAPAYVHAVREDPVRKGLLYAGTETGVYVSFDDGDHWHSLQLNLPTASIRDLAIHGDDIVVATHGRAFWILDDLSPLRQLSSEALASAAYLFRPATAIRIRRDVNQDTPLRPETPAGKNPPNGAIIDYNLQSVPQGEITLEILDSGGSVVRKFESGVTPPPLAKHLDFPQSWLREPAPLTKNAGMNRFVWDLRYPTPPALSPTYTIAAVYGENTPALPLGPLALPGQYTVRLTVAGHEYTRPLAVRMDPRVITPLADLTAQFNLGMKISEALDENSAAHVEISSLQARIKAALERLPAGEKASSVRAQAEQVQSEAKEIDSGSKKNGEAGKGLMQLNDDLATLAQVVEGADAVPTAQARQAFDASHAALQVQLRRWQALKQTSLPKLDALLKAR